MNHKSNWSGQRICLPEQDTLGGAAETGGDGGGVVTDGAGKSSTESK